MLDAGVFVVGFTLVAFAWNLSRMNDAMKEWRCECCESNDPGCLEPEEDWEVEFPESMDPVARCADRANEVDDSSMPPNDPGLDERQTTAEHGEGPQPTEFDIAMLKAAKRREHFEGMVPGSLTPYPWRSIFYGRGRPNCVRRRSSLSSSGYSMVG